VSSLTEKLKEKKQQTKQYEIEYWKPAEGDILEGEVQDIGQTITTYGDSDYIQVLTPDGKKVLAFCNGILKRLLDEENVQIGDVIAIEFLGLAESKKNPKRKFKDYILVVDRGVLKRVDGQAETTETEE
jgi:DNA helicase TIP49 (TBP-interacting protein)